MTTKSSTWKRVSRGNRCPICGRPDWCLVAGDDGNPDAVICSRVESPKRVGTKGAGWLHRLRDDDGWRDRPRQRRVRIEASAAPIIDFRAMAAECEAALGPLQRGLLAEQLGVNVESLNRLRVGWSDKHRAYTFPMLSQFGIHVEGIRLRSIDGRKWSVKGGRQGLFLPKFIDGRQLMICEGATDTAAMLDLGFAAVGRPSCNGGGAMIVGLMELHETTDVVIVADNDGPGGLGATRLAGELVAHCRSVRTIYPPAGIKDARGWVQRGASRDDVMAAIEAAPVLTLSVKGVAR